MHLPKKVLLLGSGGLKIGQAGEFDYSGSQALKALREEGIKTVLINPNIATIQTSEGMADATYFLPVTPEYVKKVIQKEEPDGLLLSFGGQTALNCGIELERQGALYKYGVKVLGTPVQAIQDTEDRELFVKRLDEIGALSARSRACRTVDEAKEAARGIGYPVMARAAYALGGSGSGICKNERELEGRCKKAFAQTIVGGAPQVLVEEWLGGWKEIEYEVVRDRAGNCVTVCNMENVDPLGIHTGDSIVVAPSQTLTDSEYHKLRRVSINVIQHLGIVGECNIQYALDPASEDYRIIEVNARLSRSSALASKATGYPLAFVAAKLALGYTLPEIENRITRVTKACFEPALDYIVVKVPRWDLSKFKNVDLSLGSEMKSVGEVMSIGRTFEEALQKALRMRTGIGAPGLAGEDKYCGNGLTAKDGGCLSISKRRRDAAFASSLKNPTDRRIFIIYRALAEGWTVDKIHALTKIDRWFLWKIKAVLDTELELRRLVGESGVRSQESGAGSQGTADRGQGTVGSGSKPSTNADNSVSTDRADKKLPPTSYPLSPIPYPLPPTLLLHAKRQGFSDARIAELTGSTEEAVRKLREENRIRPVVKQIDTLGAEYPAKTNYLYMTYNGTEDDVFPAAWAAAGGGDSGTGGSPAGGKNAGGRGAKGSVMVLGSGAYRIGSSVEFDWCCVNAAETARKTGRYSIMVNCNPETVSTDYDICDRLYFEELTLERILDIYERERPDGVILSMGGQTPNNLATKLFDNGVLIYGTSPNSIDRAEDRYKFSQLLDKLGIEQPDWRELTSFDDARAFAASAGYPVLIRPSYVLSGAAMNVAWNDETLERFLREAADVSPEHPVVISKFIENSKEIEIDAVAKRGEILFNAITEHVENAGVHSGDATVALPAQRLYIETIRKVRKITRQIAQALFITGPFNIQFLAQRNRIRVIECNLRASRSFPFCSKVSRVNMVDIAVRAMLDEPLPEIKSSPLDLEWVGVKAAQFSFSRLRGADPVSGVEMASTGEVGCIGGDINDAFLKAMLSVGYRIPQKKILLSTGPVDDKVSFVLSARKLTEMNYRLCASRGTAKFLRERGIEAEELAWPSEGGGKNAGGKDGGGGAGGIGGGTAANVRVPNIRDYIQNREIDLIINIPKNNADAELKNDYAIRRMAVDYDIPLITNIKVAQQFIEALEDYHRKGLEIKAWEEYGK